MHILSLGGKAGALLVLGLIAGCSGGEDSAESTTGGAAESATPSTPPTTPPAGAGGAQEGQQIFAGMGLCATCHGPAAQGTALAPNLTDDVWLNLDPAQPLEPQIANVIRTGVPQPKEHPAPMPPMGGASLNDAQINSLAAYIASL